MSLNIVCLRDDGYLTPAEFAALPSAVQLAVWEAAGRGRVGWRLWSDAQPGGVRVYRRAEVEALAAARPA